jgi:hypothetical protein
VEALSTGTVLVTFFSGSAVGGIATAAFQASHQHAERIRDRMVDTAEAFIVKAEEAFSFIRSHDSVMTAVLNARDPMYDALHEVAEVFGSADSLPRALERVPDLLEATEDVWGDPSPERVAALRELIDQTRIELREYRANVADDPKKAKVVASVVETTGRYAIAMSGYFARAQDSLEGMHALVAQLARVQLVFGARGDRVTSAAAVVAQAVAEQGSVVARRYGQRAPVLTFLRDLPVASKSDDAPPASVEEGAEEAASSPDSNIQAAVDLPIALIRFANVASRRVRSWWWQL